MQEQEVNISKGFFNKTIKGTLTLPGGKSPHPLIILAYGLLVIKNKNSIETLVKCS